MAAANYLKGYPYLFVRETDQTNYFCTICEAYLKEEELQSHLFDEHRAEDCSGFFVRVCVEQTDKGYFTQKKYTFVCVVCWGKFPSPSDMSTHRLSCKVSAAGVPQEENMSPKRRVNRRGSGTGRIVEEMEPTNVVSTPDIPYIVDSDEESGNHSGTNGARSSGVSPPMSNSHTEILLDHGRQNNYQLPPVKRGRKKQLHPQQVLPPYRVEERPQSGSQTPVNDSQKPPQLHFQSPSQFLQCSLCNEILPAMTYTKHLRDFHRVECPLENNLCPLCLHPVALVDLSLHLAASHGVVPQSAINALLLWVLTSNNNNSIIDRTKEAIKSKLAPKQNFDEHKPPTMMAPPMVPPMVNFPMMLQNVFPGLGGKLPMPVGKLFNPPLSSSSSVPLQPLASLTSGGGIMSPNCPPAIPSFLQALLNGESPSVQPATNSSDERRSFAPPASPLPSKLAVEAIVSKLTRKHVGPNEKESFQCLICSKWFAVPPVKHMRGHLVTFRDEKKRYVPLVGLGGGCHVCLVCFQICDSLPSVEFHVATLHQTLNQQPQQAAHNSGPEDDLPLGATYETANNNAKYNNSNNNNDIEGNGNNDLNSSLNNGGNHIGSSSSDLAMADPKGVELDNAGRVKSGKVRKQCELCGQWSNIKWFFKHMSEVHRALFCRCCREYLPIHEQEEHRRWHSEPPYMGQKIRIENGQPIIIDRKERASLTPIGSLAAWGGSSGGMVVKAIDDSVVPSSRKRKAAAGPPSTPLSEIGTATPPKIAPPPVFTGQDLGVIGKNGKDTLMPKETCPVCGILITYKNLARHIKLRHKIKYKFCHKCRKFVPNDTYEDHKLTCIQVDSSPNPRSDVNESIFSENGDLSDGGKDLAEDEGSHGEDGQDGMDLSTASSSAVGTTPPSSLTGELDPNQFDGRKSDSFRANTSKTKLESLLGKEFKHPRRRCAICGYTVSYSNFKRHLRNAHPNEYSQCEKDPGVDFGKAFATFSHIVEDDNPNQSNPSDGESSGPSGGSFVECRICGDHILQDFLTRHMKMNHPQVEQTSPNATDEKIDAAKEDEEEVHVDDDEKVEAGDGQTGSGIKTLRMRECPECKVEMRAESIVKHCKLKHKVSYKFCSVCNKYINKKAYRVHMRKHCQGKGVVTRFGGEDAKMSSSQEDESEEEEAGESAVPNGDDLDDDDDDKLTIDFKDDQKSEKSNNELNAVTAGTKV